MSLCYDFQKWTIMTMLAILTVCLVGMVNLVFGQITDSEFINCIIMQTKGSQVVLGTDEDCSTELFTSAVNYYKSQGYNETSYSNVLGEQTVTLTNNEITETLNTLEQGQKLIDGLDRGIDDLENGKNDKTPEECKALDEMGLKEKLLKQHCPDY